MPSLFVCKRAQEETNLEQPPVEALITLMEIVLQNNTTTETSD